ncbi:MAG TPA: VOC family protein [Porticoccus sp.]|nr:VOC family protein [Porticoccus sp.]
MKEHIKINYVEFPSTNIVQTKAFFEQAFAWSFEDYGPDYTAFSNEGLDGGFFKSDQSSLTENGAALIVFYSPVLDATLLKVEEAGASIVKPVFSFPGGRRFHFIEPGGNEFAVWSDIDAAEH